MSAYCFYANEIPQRQIDNGENSLINFKFTQPVHLIKFDEKDKDYYQEKAERMTKVKNAGAALLTLGIILSNLGLGAYITGYIFTNYPYYDYKSNYNILWFSLYWAGYATFFVFLFVAIAGLPLLIVGAAVEAYCKRKLKRLKAATFFESGKMSVNMGLSVKL